MSNDVINTNSIVLGVEHVHKPALLQHKSFDNLWELCEQSHGWSVKFRNEIYAKDIKYVTYKIRQLRKKKTKKVLNGCIKILQADPTNIWVYLVAGAACRIYEKHYPDGFFYFSQAALLNPNCLNTWICLSKYLKDFPFIEDVIFETIFKGLLLNDKKVDRWCKNVTYFLELSSKAPTRKPLEILSQCDIKDDQTCKQFFLEAVSQYVLEHVKKTHQISQLHFGVQAFKQLFLLNPDAMFLKKILSYTFCNNFFIHFNDLSESLINDIHIEEMSFGISFLKRMMILFFFTNNLSDNKIIQQIARILPEQMRLKRKRRFRYHSLIYFSYNDNRAVRDYYLQRKTKRVGKPRCQEKLFGIWASIKLGSFQAAWREAFVSTKYLKKKLNKKPAFRKMMLRNSYRDIWLYLLTHGASTSMRKLGLLLCLKVLEKDEYSYTTLYYAIIGCIGLGEKDLAIILLRKLLKLGFINEVILLKALLEENNDLKSILLKEVAEFTFSHEISALEAYNTEKVSKALKWVCKASVLVPYNSLLYEWLGIYFHERGSYEKSEKYFEIALFYNPSSWVSIKYYSTLLAMHDTESSKLFLDLYRCENSQRHPHSYLIAFKAGLFYTKYYSEKYDFYKACENLRFGMLIAPEESDFKQTIEMLGEAYCLFGMAGVAINWLKDAYISNNKINYYAGCQLAKQLLYTKGVNSYMKMMRKLLNKTGLTLFVTLQNAAHSFLLKAIYFFHKSKFCLSQTNAQIALIICARAILSFSNYSATWKILGDTLYYCGQLDHSTGFLYVPHWLIPSVSSKKIVLVCRAQALKLAIRCYYAGLNAPIHSQEMKASLWNSIAVTYKKLSFFCSRSQNTHILKLAVNCNLRALNENVKDSFSWNSLGVLLGELGAADFKTIYPYLSTALSTSVELSRIVRYKFIPISNLGFLSLSKGDYEASYNLFLSARGQSTSLDFPWIGQIFLNLINNNPIETTLNHMIFLFELTNFSPDITILFTYLLFLSHHFTNDIIQCYGKRYAKCEAGNFTFNQRLLSSLVNKKKKKFTLAKLDLLFALRTCAGLKLSGLREYNTALYEFHLMQSDQRFGKCLLDINTSVCDIRNMPYFISTKSTHSDCYETIYISIIKWLVSERNPELKKMLYLALALLEFSKGKIDFAKYYFLKAQKDVD